MHPLSQVDGLFRYILIVRHCKTIHPSTDLLDLDKIDEFQETKTLIITKNHYLNRFSSAYLYYICKNK